MKMNAMTPDERNKLLIERAQIEARLSGTFVSPKDIRRLDEIISLLISDGLSDQIRLRAGKLKKSRRVTSFTRDRR